MKIGLSRIHYPITSLGPGNRIGIWFQGCSIRCPGCISADTWAFGEGSTTVSELVVAIEHWFSEADGITISGGEPFDQPKALFELLKELRARTSGDILVYSGYTLQEIEKLYEFSGLIDAIISGPFRIEEAQTLFLRGSDNQELHALTALGRKLYQNEDTSLINADDTLHGGKKTLDIMFADDNTVWIAGIPKRGELAQISKVLQLQGFESFTTEDGGGKY